MSYPQPHLPAEQRLSDAEIDFIESSPPGLFPENQDSNFGFIIRKIWADRIQELIEQQQTLYNEFFVTSSQTYLDEWEEQQGLPVAPINADDTLRRTIVRNRIHVGPFTRRRRDDLIWSFIVAALGGPVLMFATEGIPLTLEGIPLHTEAQALPDQGVPMTDAGVALTTDGIPLLGAGYFNIIERVSQFNYEVRISAGITPDLPGMTRELLRMTPAGISFSIVQTQDIYKRFTASMIFAYAGVSGSVRGRAVRVIRGAVSATSSMGGTVIKRGTKPIAGAISASSSVSGALSRVSALKPIMPQVVNLTLPTLTGELVQGSVLTITPGTWSSAIRAYSTVGGSVGSTRRAQIMQAYLAIGTSLAGIGYLDPNGDGGQNGWAKQSGAIGYAMVAKTTRQPETPSTATWISGTNGQIQDFVFPDGGETGGLVHIDGSMYRLRVYGRTDSASLRKIQYAITTDFGVGWSAFADLLENAQGAQWRSIDLTSLITSQSNLNGFRVRLQDAQTAGGSSGAVYVYQVYLEQEAGNERRAEVTRAYLVVP